MTAGEREALWEMVCTVVEAWHGKEVFDLYRDHSPEMQQIKAAIAALSREAQPVAEPFDKMHKEHRETRKAAESVDWGQVLSHGGEPCFHIEGCRFCLRAKHWDGHDVMHKFMPLVDLIAAEQVRSVMFSAAAQAVAPLNAPSDSNANSNALQEHPNTLGNLTARFGEVPQASMPRDLATALLELHARTSNTYGSEVLWDAAILLRRFAKSPAAALDALNSIDARLRECFGLPITAEEAYDSFYQDLVAEALGSDKPEKSDSPKRGLDHAAGQPVATLELKAGCYRFVWLNRPTTDGLHTFYAAPIQPTSEEQP